jgi:PAS domain S-box-containing protein
MLGYVSSELPDVPATWHQLLHPEDSAAAPLLAGRHATPGQRPFDVEFRLRHRRGHYLWMHCLGLQTIGEDGQLTRVVGMQVDISERKETEEACIAGDARLQHLSESGPLGAFELDFANQQFWYSPEWKRLLGFAEDEVIDQAVAFLAVLPASESAPGLEKWFLQHSPGQDSLLTPVSLQRQDGTPVALLLGVHRAVNRKQELTRVTGFVCPLPATAAEPAGGLPGGLTADAFSALAEAVLLTDTNGRLLGLNATAARLLQLPAAQAVARPLGEIFRLVHRESGHPGDDPCERALASEHPLPLCSDHGLVVGDAPPVPIVWNARGSYDEGGRARGVVIVFRNPDEMTLSPEELVKSNRYESLALLAGGIAHDFNNLLTTILGAVSLAKDNRDYSALADAEQSCMTAKGLTKQLLAFAKGGAGARVVVPVPAILHDSVKIASAGSTAQITVEAAEEVWPVMVDRSQILQVFQNFIVNALQAMPPEPHRARIQLKAVNTSLAAGQVEGLAAGDYVEFEVRDNGAGIKPENLARIFDPFFTTKKHGTGLGLATVLSVVRKHGGQIAIGSTVGTGTVFTVFLPRAEQPVEVQARRAPSLRFGTGRVLFMDDDPKICTLTANMLQSLDYKFDIAKNGEEAVTFYQRYLNIGRPYDAVIMDLTVIGGMGGEECFKALRELDPDVRAIVSSGYDNDDMALRYLDMGFCGYLTKPYRVTDLGKVIKAVLG